MIDKYFKFIAFLSIPILWVGSYLLHFWEISLPLFKYPINILGVAILLMICVLWYFLPLNKRLKSTLFCYKSNIYIYILWLTTCFILLFLSKTITNNNISSISNFHLTWLGLFTSLISLIYLFLQTIHLLKQKNKLLICKHIFGYCGFIMIIFYLQFGINDRYSSTIDIHYEYITFLEGGDQIKLQHIDYKKNSPIVNFSILDDTHQEKKYQIAANQPIVYKGWKILLLSCDGSTKQLWAKCLFVYDTWKIGMYIGIVFLFIQIIINGIVPILTNRKCQSKIV